MSSKRQKVENITCPGGKPGMNGEKGGGIPGGNMPGGGGPGGIPVIGGPLRGGGVA